MPLYTVIVETTELHVIEIAAPSADKAADLAWTEGEVISTKELNVKVTETYRSDETPLGREYRRWQEDLQEIRERLTWLKGYASTEQRVMEAAEINMRLRKLLDKAGSPEQKDDVNIVRRDMFIHCFGIQPEAANRFLTSPQGA
jgi:hypothetical protein